MTGSAMATRWLAVAALMCACQGPPDEVRGDPPPDFDAEGDGVLLARLESFPAGGVELTVRVEDEQGALRTDDVSNAFAWTWLDSKTAEPIAARRTTLPDPGYTLVLVLPETDAAAQAAQIDAVRAFIAARPDGERVALYRWGESIEQVADYTADRAVLDQMLDRIGPRHPGAALATPAAAQRDAVGSVRSVGGEAPRAMRSAVIVAGALPGPAPDGGGQSVVVQWVVPDVAPADFERLGTGRVAATLTDAAGAIDAFASGGFYDIAVCGVGPTDWPARVELMDRFGTLTLLVPGTTPEWRSGTCEPSAMIDGDRGYPDLVELVFTAAQREVYDKRVAGPSKADFELSIRFATDQAPVAATAHLRGKGSIGCERKNYTINLDGKRPRYLMPGSATDEFYLISMCLDDRYVRAHTVYRMLGELGLFPPKFRLIEVLLDGETRGVYMFIEKPAEELRSDHARVSSVIRRRYDAGEDITVPEIEWSRSADADAVADYDALLGDIAGLSGDALVATLDDRIDVDAYLRLLAVQSLLHNGDHVDEVWLWATDRLRTDGSIGPWFQLMGWDPDDIFNGCHYSGSKAFPDAYDLSYCAEAELDDILLSDPVTYARYVDVLQGVIDAITQQRFRAALDETAAELEVYISRPEIAAAMVELIEDVPGATDPKVALQEIAAEIDALEAALVARRALLQQRIDTYRAENP
jgi:hypothetical protein